MMSNQVRAGINPLLEALSTGLAHLVRARLIHVVRRHARSRAGERAMARLDDHMLRDIGLTHSEIHAAAYGLLSRGRASGSASRDTVADQPIPIEPAEAAALVRELSDRLLHAPTATDALHVWCAARGLSAGPIIAVKQDPDRPRHPEDDVFDELRPERHERIAYRHVRLVRGVVVLSEADNWFIPDRLPPEIRDLLETTDVPFGAAVARLRPSRRTYFVRFPELGTAGEASSDRPAALSPSTPILEHKAVVLDRNRQPLSVVSERYCAALLGGVETPLQAVGKPASDAGRAQR